MNTREKDPEIYHIMLYLLIFIGFYIIHRVFSLNEPDNDDNKINEHSN
jgi:hypothetical protein